MSDLSGLESVFNKYGCTDFKWIDPRDIVTGQWVRAKCIYGCANYGQHACCPPNAPPVSECQQFFREYGTGVLFHFAGAPDTPDERREWGRKANQDLLSVEREVFLMGYQKAFLLLMTTCRLCDECTKAREDCRHPQSARPTPESMGIDVYSTVPKYGFPIQVLTDYSQTMNRYAFLLIE
jgi:predicted metal-binding protein